MMRKEGLAGAIVFAIMSAAYAQGPTVAPQLAGIGFLVGQWDAGAGQIADTGGTSTGRSTITAEVGGKVLLRRDHTDLFDKSHKPIGGFDQLMMIYSEGGTVQADYSDGSHIIHYVRGDIEPGKAVTLVSAAQPSAPTYRLTYTLNDPATLAVAFAMAPPGSNDFHPIATGTLHKAK